MIYFLLRRSRVGRLSDEMMCDVDQVPEDFSHCIILGAKLGSGDALTPILNERLDMAIRLHGLRPDMKFVISGDGTKIYSNDVAAMRAYLEDNSAIPGENIFIDNQGVHTYASIKNFKKRFRVSKVIILTSMFHMPRSLYIASRFGLTALGIKGQPYNPRLQSGYKTREKLAMVKAYWLFAFDREV